MADEDDALQTIRVRVIMRDGQDFTVEVLNPDMIRFEKEAPRQSWGSAKQSPILWQTYIAWAAATRERLIDGMPFAAFEREALRVRILSMAPVDPTPAVPGDG